MMAPRGSRALLMAATAVLSAAACANQTPSPTPVSSQGPPEASPGVSARPSAALVPIGSAGAIALLGANGTLSIVDSDGTKTQLSDTADGLYGFPTWSPDGTHIAAIRSDGTQSSVVVFEAADAGAAIDPTVIFERANASPFYLFWAPDGETVSFLASESDVLSLRVAPADGSAPIDGSGAGSIVRSGNPFYYDWLGGDRLLAHIGAGAEAFLGEIGLDGRAAGSAIDSPGDFRSAVVSADHGSIAFVRGVLGGPGEVVISAPDGTNEHAMSVYGQTALVFDPAGSRVASIGSIDPGDTAGFPLGPLRLIDATGEIRTLMDGYVVSFWWSPDGSTIAALRVQPAIGSAVASGASQSPEARTEVRLLFIDVASGRILSQPIVQPAERFVSALLAYFDQYALSHRVWAPDSSSILLPEVDSSGRTRVMVRFPDGADPIPLDGDIGFWSP